MDRVFEQDRVIIRDIECFDLEKSCLCGQAFRWRAFDSGQVHGMLGIVKGRAVLAYSDSNSLILQGCSKDDVDLWVRYFDLERDYLSIQNEVKCDDRLCVCFPVAEGIRVFNQDPFEALISFIISQNNNIKRISGIVERLCRLCGVPISFMGETLYAFPTVQAIASLSLDDLKGIGAGYRAQFILDAAKRVCDGYDIDRLSQLSLSEARAELLTFNGIGPKVADCVLLFSLGHTNAFPVDVWIDRAMKALFFEGENVSRKELYAAVEKLGKYSGLIQQYIFFYTRESVRKGS